MAFPFIPVIFKVVKVALGKLTPMHWVVLILLVMMGIMGTRMFFLAYELQGTKADLTVRDTELKSATQQLETATEQIATLKQVQAVNDNISLLLEEQNQKLEIFSNQVFYTLSGDINKVKAQFKNLPKNEANVAAEAKALSEVRNKAQWIMYCKSNPAHPNCIDLTKGVTP
jgi:uncharacterized membrane protein